MALNHLWSQLSDATKVKFTTVEEYEPVGVSAPKLVHDEAFRTHKFIEHAPVFLCDFDLDVLKQRPKKCAAERDEMQAIIDVMKGHPGRVTSCIVVDRKGRVLVQAFDPPHPDFFREVVRRRLTPFYSHRLLRPKDGSELNLVDSGSVSDGDDDVVEEKEPTALAPSPARGTKRKRVLPAPVMTSPSRSGSRLDPFLLSSSPVIADEEEDVPILIFSFPFFSYGLTNY
jgi:hypothetical protein